MYPCGAFRQVGDDFHQVEGMYVFKKCLQVFYCYNLADSHAFLI
jgi:hypothetical protein